MILGRLGKSTKSISLKNSVDRCLDVCNFHTIFYYVFDRRTRFPVKGFSTPRYLISIIIVRLGARRLRFVFRCRFDCVFTNVARHCGRRARGQKTLADRRVRRLQTPRLVPDRTLRSVGNRGRRDNERSQRVPEDHQTRVRGRGVFLESFEIGAQDRAQEQRHQGIAQETVEQSTYAYDPPTLYRYRVLGFLKSFLFIIICTKIASKLKFLTESYDKRHVRSIKSKFSLE